MHVFRGFRPVNRLAPARIQSHIATNMLIAKLKIRFAITNYPFDLKDSSVSVSLQTTAGVRSLPYCFFARQLCELLAAEIFNQFEVVYARGLF